MATIKVPPPVTIDPTRSREDHIHDHEWIHRHAEEDVIYSSDYGNLQAAIEAALGPRVILPDGSIQTREATKPLIIAPGQYTLTEPLQIIGAQRLRIIAHNVTLIAGVDMSALIEMTGCAYCHIEGDGLWMGTAPGVVVQDMLLLQNNLAIAARSTAKNTFSGHISISGDFVNGVRIGRDGDFSQCDQTVMRGIGVEGRSGSDKNILHKNGFYVGSNAWGNNLIHRVQDCSVWDCGVGIRVAATSAMLENITFTNNLTDLVLSATSMCCAKQIRSEGGIIFVSTPLEDINSSTTWAASLILEDALFATGNTRSDGIFMNLTGAGTFDLSRVFVFYPAAAPHAPRIHALPAHPLVIHVNGLAMNHSDVLTGDVFNRSANVQIEGVVMQIDDSGGLVAMKKLMLVADWNV